MIFLRALEPYDIDTLLKWENDPAVWEVSGTQIPFSRHTMMRYIESVQPDDFYTAKQLRLMIDWEENGERKTVGCVDLFDFDPPHRRAGFGLLIDQDARGKNVGMEAMQKMEKYAFSILQLHQLYCIIGIENTPSLRLFDKMEYQRNGVLQDWQLRNGKWENAVLFQKMNTTSPLL